MPALRILLADDNRDCTESLSRLLRLVGHEVWTVDCGEAVIGEAEHCEPDLVLVDLIMPDMDGFEVARRLQEKANGHRPKVVALTGLATEEDKRRTQEAGFDGHIAKPVTLPVLEKLLDGFTNQEGDGTLHSRAHSTRKLASSSPCDRAP